MSTNSPTRCIRAMVVMLTAALVPVPSASAQMSAVSAVGIVGGPDDLGPMAGVGFTTMSPIRRTPEALQLSGFFVRGRHAGFGSPCAGLIRPGTCVPQALGTTSSMGLASIALARRVYMRDAVQVHLGAGPAAGVASTTSRGTVSGESVRGSAPVWGAVAGADLFWWPKPRSSLGVHLGLSAQGLRATGTQCVDCYIPFGEGFVQGRLQFGLTFGRPVVTGASRP